MNNDTKKVAIIGTGFVGTAIAYSIVNQGITEELVLIDVDTAKAEGEAADLRHGVPFGPSRVKVRAGDYSECTDTDVIIITAGVNQKPGETRLALVERNAAIMKSIIHSIMDSGFNGIMIIASNPVDIMTYIAWKESGLPKSSVIGSGTTLDTARLRSALSEYFDVDPRNIHTYIMGEHGDTEFATWSHCSIASQPIKEYIKKHGDTYNEAHLNDIFISVRDAAYYIIERKKATYFGIGMCVARIAKAVLNNERAILPVSVYLEGLYGQNDVYSSAPAVITRQGVESIIELDLSSEEMDQLNHSISVLKETMKTVL
ncbi:L-lactate dehydrogenase [Bacillus sp. 1P06AnD]|uniref:L-lactate dehydrogenase n=1 Tax=Bacillus sp. 1P06AnD TaxID=3132208 RepID=UPI0039A12BCD